MSARAMGAIRHRAEHSRTVELAATPADGGGVLLELQQYSRRNAKADVLVDLSLDDARLFLRKLQGAVDEAFRREKEAFRAAARELQP